MTREVITVDLYQSMDEILGVLLQNGIGGAPVVDENGRAIGIVSTLDLITAGGLGMLESQLVDLPPQLSAQKPILYVSPTDPVKRALMQIVTHRVGRVMVIDEDGRLAGIVSRTDLMRYYADQI